MEEYDVNKYIYTTSPLAGHSTCQRKLTRVQFIAHPFTIWTDDDTHGAKVSTTPGHATVHRSRNNRAARKALAREKLTALDVVGCYALT